MFRFRRTEQKYKFLPLVIFRLFLSLSMFFLLAFLSYQAFFYFSGQGSSQDLIKTIIELKKNPQKAVFSLSGILGIKIPESVILPKITLPRQEEKSGQSKLILKFGVISDSHNDQENLGKALRSAKENGAKFIIGLGDWTDTGTIPEFEKAKLAFEGSPLPFYLTAGDHDLWDSRDKKLPAARNFNNFFGSPYQSFSDSSIRFVIVYNSDNYEGLDTLQREWLEELMIKLGNEQPKKTFIFLHESLFHSTSDRVMGSPRKADSSRKADEAGKNQKEIVDQAAELIRLFKEAGAAEIFAGDIHAFSRYEEPQSGLKMTTVGAVSRERNTQSPRYVLVDVFEDGHYNVLDLEIK